MKFVSYLHFTLCVTLLFVLIQKATKKVKTVGWFEHLEGVTCFLRF